MDFHEIWEQLRLAHGTRDIGLVHLKLEFCAHFSIFAPLIVAETDGEIQAIWHCFDGLVDLCRNIKSAMTSKRIWLPGTSESFDFCEILE